jgi:tripartite-type tricarboxylate transporter receptor subunit TctC
LSTRRTVLRATLSVAAWPIGASAWAAGDYPQAPVTMIVPFPAGGPTDIIARIVSQQMTEAWKQPVVMDYKPGASTMLGVSAVARAAPDGLTIGIVNPAFVINPSLQKKLLYRSEDLAPIMGMMELPLAIAAWPGAPFNTLREMVAYAKHHPGEVTFASPGTGGPSHLTGELLARQAGFEWTHVPYKGSSPAHTDVIGGRVMVMIDPLFSLTPHIDSGRLKMIATTGPVAGYEKYEAVSTVYPGFGGQQLIGLIAPRATPPAIIDKIQRDVATALAVPSVKKRIEDLGMVVTPSTPAEFRKRIDADTAQWAQVIREAKIEQQ